MKKTTFSLVFLLISTIGTFAAGTWQSLNLTKTAGGTISTNINMMALDGGRLYVATSDGIWVSPSANGGDFEPYGLQGVIVSHLNFKVLKLAVVTITASDDATKTCNKLYKHNGSNWVITNFNPTSVSTFGGPAANFDQIQDGANNTVIIVPTWGNGMWRSTDGGTSFTQYAYGTNADGAVYKTVTGIWAYGNKLYGTDKTTGSAQYLLTSLDYGATWTNVFAGNFFNPRAFHTRKFNAIDFLYMGGDSDNGAKGSLDFSEDAGANWTGSFSVGSDFWFTNKIIGDDNGPLYISCSKSNVMVSMDNGETFAPLGTGIGIIASPPKYFLSDLVKSATKLYVSTRTLNGIYVYDLTNSAVNTLKTNTLSMYLDPAQNELFVKTQAGARVSIYSVTGMLLQSVVAPNANPSINVKDLNASVYMVKVVSADGKLFTGRFVKN